MSVNHKSRGTQPANRGMIVYTICNGREWEEAKKEEDRRELLDDGTGRPFFVAKSGVSPFLTAFGWRGFFQIESEFTDTRDSHMAIVQTPLVEDHHQQDFMLTNLEAGSKSKSNKMLQKIHKKKKARTVTLVLPHEAPRHSGQEAGRRRPTLAPTITPSRFLLTTELGRNREQPITSREAYLYTKLLARLSELMLSFPSSLLALSGSEKTQTFG
ncbi:hypothetical protein QBC38DRAFT_442285 [Podospora fimiseda]|uniref:Uncharacterized protein n=1 Tax=Podospora fimiseda TaxID=252190 RepID=A0AAN7BT22_9PEZI|nr:hypothetical protein QBC38DRAFT_442285 [Podospora fimiseda]